MDKIGKSSLQEILKSKNDLRNRIKEKSHSNLLLEIKEPWDLMHEMFNNIELLILFRCNCSETFPELFALLRNHELNS